VVVKLNSDPAIVYAIDLTTTKEIQVGRSLESTIVVNELSVSRRHCLIKVDQDRKSLVLVDMHAKFGTVVEVEKAEIDDQEEYQKGRTKLHFRK
jgi:pSer/pThr/pTyr-binding forkhead associated (FHA) protein